MYNDELEKLISFALADGELTEKEKQILYKKAESMGVDLDEFEMVLDARLYEKQQEAKKETTSSSAPKSDKLGDVKKCPACGAMTQSFQTICIDCGHEFTNINANSSITKLFELLSEAEKQRGDESIMGSLVGTIFKTGFSSKTDKRKKEIISSFPIPNTRDDIIEFLSLAFPKSILKGNLFTRNNPEYQEHNKDVDVWKAKCEQIIMKAKFSMKDDKRTLDEIMYYAKQLKIN